MQTITRISICLLVTIALFGCQSDKDKGPQMSQQELMNRSKLEAYPNAVGDAFMRDYPNATVTRVDTYNDATGRVVYEVNFVDREEMREVVYTSEGERVMAPAQRTSPPAPPEQPTPPASPRAPSGGTR
jgi:hypothetical protein